MDVNQRISKVARGLGMNHIDSSKLICFRSSGSKSRAIARIWALPKIWQKALNVKPHYAVEVISERYDKLGEDEKDKTLIHELLHIPKSFSGAVVNHNSVQFDGMGGHVRRRIDHRTVEKLFKLYKNMR